MKVNIKKIVFKPSQKMDFFGYTIDTAGTFLVIKTHKACVPRIKRQICTVLKQGSASARVIAKVAGLCVSVAWAVTPCKLFLRHLYRLLSISSSWNGIL